MLLSDPLCLDSALLYPSPQSLYSYIQYNARLRNGQIRLPGQLIPIDWIVP